MGVFEKKVYLSSPTMHKEEQEYVAKAFKTNWVSTIGENIDEIERQLSARLQRKFGVALGAGTHALHMAVKMAGVKRGDYVFCSDMTFSATVNPIVYEGGIPIFIDSDYETWNMDPVALEKAFELYPNVKVVMIAHLYGTPAKIDKIKEICDKHKAVLIEDAAESLGSTFDGKETGSFGKYGIISFNGNKIITGSCGGMFLTDSEEDMKHVRKLSTQARELAPWYQHKEIGYNYRISNIVAGVIRGQIPHLEEHIAQKTAIYFRYKEGLKGLPLIVNPYLDNTVPNHWLTCILINKDAMLSQKLNDNDYTYVKESGKSCPMEIFERLSKINAESRPIWKPMHMQPIYKDNPFVKVSEKAVNEDIFLRGHCLPSDNKMTSEEQDIIIEEIRRCFD